MLERLLIPALAPLCSIIFAVAALLTPLTVVLRTGLYCTAGNTTVVTCLAATTALIGGSIVMKRLKHRPHNDRFILALLVPLVALGTHIAAMNADADAEIACRQRADAPRR